MRSHELEISSKIVLSGIREAGDILGAAAEGTIISIVTQKWAGSNVDFRQVRRAAWKNMEKKQEEKRKSV